MNETKRNETKRNETKRNGYYCLLINNYFKIFLITLLSLLFSISCSNETKTGGRTLSYYAGNWYGSLSGSNEEHLLLTINTDSSLILKKEYTEGKNDETIPATSITRNSDTSYTFDYYDSSQGNKGNITLNFSSSTQGTFAGSSPGENPFNITKK